MVPAQSIAERVNEVRRRIALACERSGRSLEEIALVAVTKGVASSAIQQAAAAAILTNLDTKLENAGVDLHIPWLGNRRLRFTFH